LDAAIKIEQEKEEKKKRQKKKNAKSTHNLPQSYYKGTKKKRKKYLPSF